MAGLFSPTTRHLQLAWRCTHFPDASVYVAPLAGSTASNPPSPPEMVLPKYRP
jgi:hypothetical protein